MPRGAERPEVSESGPQFVAAHDHVRGHEVAPPRQREHGGGGQAREDRGELVDLVGCDVQQQVLRLAGGTGGLETQHEVVHLPMVALGHGEHGLALVGHLDRVERVARQAPAGLAQVDDGVGHAAGADALERAAHRHHVDLDALGREPPGGPGRKVGSDGGTGEVGGRAVGRVDAARDHEVGSREPQPDGGPLVDGALQCGVGGDERGVEPAGVQPRGRISGAHLDELDVLDDGRGVGPAERAQVVAGPTQQLEHRLAEPALRRHRDPSGHRRRLSSTANTSVSATSAPTRPARRW